MSKSISKKFLVFIIIIGFIFNFLGIGFGIESVQAIDYEPWPLPYEGCTHPEYKGDGTVLYYPKRHKLKSQTLYADKSPYCISQDTVLDKEDELIVEPGVVIKIGGDYYESWHYRGSLLRVYGKLYLNGIKDKPVVFTSIKDDEFVGDTNQDGFSKGASGDWGRIVLYGYKEKEINNTIFRYGGGNMSSEMVLVQLGGEDNVSILNSEISVSERRGIRIIGGIKEFKYNRLINNYSFGLYSQGNTLVDARYNWWGSQQGPYVEGENENPDPNAQKIFGNVLYEPWLGAPPNRNSIKEWRQKIEPGDILYDPYSAGVGHVGMYVGNGQVVEAQGDYLHPNNAEKSKVNINPLWKWDYPFRKSVYLLRVKKPENLTQTEFEQAKQNVVDFVLNQADKAYDWAWLQKSTDENSEFWYCSELVWAAYKNQGIDLEHYADSGGIVSPISPVEIYLDNDTYVVDQHLEVKKDFNFASLLIFSPVNVRVVDPWGRETTNGNLGIPNSLYLQDMVGENGEHYDKLILPKIIGKYKVFVEAKDGANPEDVYSLKYEYEGGEYFLADDVFVNQLPEKPYLIDLRQRVPQFGFGKTRGSVANNLSAAVLEMQTLNKNDFQVNLTPYQDSQASFVLQNSGSVPLKYRSEIVGMSGELCEALEFNNFEKNTTSLAFNAKHDFNLNLSMLVDDLKYQYKSCQINLKLTAWQQNLIDESLGFNDEKFINFEVNSSVWQTEAPGHLVINQIYASGDNDWIELYNPTNEDIDLAEDEYRLEKTSSALDPDILMRFGNTDDGSYPGGTVIPAQGSYLIVRDDAENSLLELADAVALRSEFTWSGSGYTLYLADGPVSEDVDEDIIDYVGFGSATYAEVSPAQAIEDNKSISRYAPTYDTNHNQNDFISIDNPEPEASGSRDLQSNTSGQEIVLNEFLPDPVGSDSAEKPEGEWVELYNLSQETQDLTGYYLEDEAGNSIDVELCRVNSQSLNLEASDFMVVYVNAGGECNSHNFSLNNSGDTIYLYNSEDEIIDEVVYEGSEEDKSIARIPDGSGEWQDPVPTPGFPNRLKENEDKNQKEESENKENSENDLVNNNQDLNKHKINNKKAAKQNRKNKDIVEEKKKKEGEENSKEKKKEQEDFLLKKEVTKNTDENDGKELREKESQEDEPKEKESRGVLEEETKLKESEKKLKVEGKNVNEVKDEEQIKKENALEGSNLNQKENKVEEIKNVLKKEDQINKEKKEDEKSLNAQKEQKQSLVKKEEDNQDVVIKKEVETEDE